MQVLRAAGYDAMAADSGERALGLLGRSRPAVVLRDIGLPGEDGDRVAERIRALTGTLAPLPIAVTG